MVSARLKKTRHECTLKGTARSSVLKKDITSANTEQHINSYHSVSFSSNVFAKLDTYTVHQFYVFLLP